MFRIAATETWTDTQNTANLTSPLLSYPILVQLSHSTRVFPPDCHLTLLIHTA